LARVHLDAGGQDAHDDEQAGVKPLPAPQLLGVEDSLPSPRGAGSI
jgi:hypothetical protein